MTYGMQVNPMHTGLTGPVGPYGIPDFAPQGWIGNALGGIAPWAARQIGLPSQIGQLAGGVARLLPFEVDPITAAYGGQIAPQGFFGNVLGGVAPWAARQIGLPSPIGQMAGGLARLLPFQVDPVTAAYNAQIAPQGIFGGLLGSTLGRTAGGALGGWLGGRQFGQTAGGALGGALGGLLPFGVDTGFGTTVPAQFAPQGFFGNVLGGVAPWAARQIGLPSPVGQLAGGLARLLPFEVDPITAAYASGQVSPAGFVPIPVDPFTAAYATGQYPG